jgi:hypothetical protein
MYYMVGTNTYFGQAEPHADKLWPVGHEDGHRVTLNEALAQEEVGHPGGNNLLILY